MKRSCRNTSCRLDSREIKITHRAALQVDDEVVLRSVVADRYERKGHQFIAIHLSFCRGEDIALDIEHHAIFRIITMIAVLASHEGSNVKL